MDLQICLSRPSRESPRLQLDYCSSGVVSATAVVEIAMVLPGRWRWTEHAMGRRWQQGQGFPFLEDVSICIHGKNADNTHTNRTPEQLPLQLAPIK